MGIDRRAIHRDQFLGALKQSPQLMGILNVTPDSFSDGGRHFDPAVAVARAKAMVAEGAAVVDVGGEFDNPGHLPVSQDEELQRVAPVLEALTDLDTPISIDTSKAAVAPRRRGSALASSTTSGDCSAIPAWRTPSRTASAVVVTHNREEKDPAIDILDDVERFFERSLNLAACAGVPSGRILLDPGVGFGKTRQQNHRVLEFRSLPTTGAPILVGLSRKSFIGGIIDAEVDRRLPGTLAADTIALMRGASVLRVHDVVENRAALAVFMALRDSAAPSPAPELQDNGKARVVLALGGNVGDKVKSLRRALRLIAGVPEIELTAVSRFYRTAPWGKTDQDWFVNACALGRTSLNPEALLERVKRLEVELGRAPAERWGPRVIDIDLIAYADIALKTERLTLPHPELFNRAFVLVPLAEIAPDLVVAGLRIGEAAARLGDEAAELLPLD